MAKRRRILADNSVRITFRGDGVTDGSIDARQLGQSLIGLADTFQTARAITADQEAPQLAAKITATGAGSFWVDITLVTESGAVQAVLDTLSGKVATAAINLQEFLGWVAAAYLFIKNKNGRRVVASKELPEDPGQIEVTLDDATTTVIASKVYDLIKDTGFQKAAKESVKALAQDGVDEIRIQPRNADDSDDLITIKAEDYKAFTRIDNEPIELVNKIDEMIVSPNSVSFVGKQWQLNDGDASFSAGIEDQEFLDRISKGALRIGGNDMFKVLLRTEQQIAPNGKLKTIRTVVQVLDVIRGGTQGELF